MPRFRAGPKKIPRARARARPPAPALGAGALGPEGLGPLGALGHLGTWALGPAPRVGEARRSRGQPDVAGRGRREPLLACSLASGGAAFGPWPPAFWPAPCVGEARHSRGQPDVAGRGGGGRRGSGRPSTKTRA